MQISRKQFLMSGLAALGAVELVGGVSGCGSDDGAAAGGHDCKSENALVDIRNNHGHQLTVSVADVAAGQAKTYDIRGTAAHTHSVTLSGEHFTKLKSGGQVLVDSTSDGVHLHTVTVRCG